MYIVGEGSLTYKIRFNCGKAKDIHMCFCQNYLAMQCFRLPIVMTHFAFVIFLELVV